MPKLVKLQPNFLSTPLVISIILASFDFPDIAKIVAVVPIDKKTDDKYDLSNF